MPDVAFSVDPALGTYWDSIRQRGKLAEALCHQRIAAWGVDARQRELLVRALPLLEEKRIHFPLHLPLAVADAVVTGCSRSALHVAGATWMAWAGARLHDDRTDGACRGPWAELSMRELTGIAFTLATVCAPRLLGEAPGAPAVRARLQRAMCIEMLATFEGQGLDLSLTGSEAPSPAEVERSVVGKNGAPTAVFCRLGALAAGADDATALQWGEFGRALGVVYQLSSDLNELLSATPSPDLVQGTRTLHIALWLETLAGQARVDALRLLAECRSSASHRAEVQRRLRSPTVFVPWMRVLRRHVHEARATLSALAPPEPVATALATCLALRTPSCMDAFA